MVNVVECLSEVAGRASIFDPAHFRHEIPGSDGRRLMDPLSNAWPEFVGPDRMLYEGPFLLELLNRYRLPAILDAAMGVGTEVTWLSAKGYDIIGNEVNGPLRRFAIEKASKLGVPIAVSNVDWLELTGRFGFGRFDVVLLLGNSLSLLLDRGQRHAVGRQILEILKPGGALIVDERNFSYIRSHREKILSGNWRFSKRFVYCGHRIEGAPISIAANAVEFGYYAGVEMLGSLKMYPFEFGEMPSELLDAGFSSVEVCHDFGFSEAGEADFHTYILSKADRAESEELRSVLHT